MGLRIPSNTSLALFLLFAYITLQWIAWQSVGSNGGSENHPSRILPPSGHPSIAVLMDRDNTNQPFIDLEKEIQKGLEYSRSIKDTKRKLLFVHIPKTAGTTIEEVGGLQAKLAWGSCLFNHRPKRSGNVCQYPPGQFEWPTRIGYEYLFFCVYGCYGARETHGMRFPSLPSCRYWHLPPQLFPIKGINPYEGADLFAVVRDPYDRLISEFYYICRRKITKYWNYIDCNRTRLLDPEYMNQWLRDKLDQMSHQDMSPQDYLSYNGHFTPQSHFLVSFPAQIRMIDYVLRMDNLKSQFHALMTAYGIDAEMLDYRKNVARNDTGDLDARHFDTKTLALLNDRYEHDVAILQNQKLS